MTPSVEALLRAVLQAEQARYERLLGDYARVLGDYEALRSAHEVARPGAHGQNGRQHEQEHDQGDLEGRAQTAPHREERTPTAGGERSARGGRSQEGG